MEEDDPDRILSTAELAAAIAHVKLRAALREQSRAIMEAAEQERTRQSDHQAEADYYTKITSLPRYEP